MSKAIPGKTTTLIWSLYGYTYGRLQESETGSALNPRRKKKSRSSALHLNVYDLHRSRLVDSPRHGKAFVSMKWTQTIIIIIITWYF